jgi:hypothetical protein
MDDPEPVTNECCRCEQVIPESQRHGLDLEGRAWCLACVKKHRPKLLTTITPTKETT